MPEPAISETEVVNRALARLGADPIQNIADMSTKKGANAARLYYESRDALLRKCRWNFARTFVTLATLAPAPAGLMLLPDPDYRGGIVYTGAYQLPSDYARLSAVAPYTAHWRIVGKAIYTDAAPPPNNQSLIGLQPAGADGADNVPSVTGSSGNTVGIEYIAKVADPTKWDPQFARCLSLMLSFELAFAVNAIQSLRAEIKADFKEEFADAMFTNGAEQWPEQLFDTVLVDVRLGYGGAPGGIWE